MNPTFRDQLKQWKKENGMQHKDPPIVESPKKSPPKKMDKLSESDLRYLMGTGRPTYRRNKGALRQR
ncbi:hypothetical protein E1I69_09440 [Bacillus timonensis]|uniref:Phage protein n=1 Tax=Bacillus timonensis TaxID=1033734 RepID=A0A4V3V826_9BACI|nr:hypothetical protein [Bacillus timonensis]THE13083.1 hypothetical protein E1I69_09440 [Bacillus timonensis]